MQYLLWNSARWSSTGLPMTCARFGDPGGIRTRDLDLERVASWARLDDGVATASIPRAAPGSAARRAAGFEIGRASCRERVWMQGGGGSGTRRGGESCDVRGLYG